MQNSYNKIINFLRGLKNILIILIITFFIQTFFFQPFYIPSASMYPTLIKGDFLLVSKFDYGFSRFTLPFFSKMLPNGRVLVRDNPNTGDLVVFYNQKDMGKNYVKRILGVPGDRVFIKNGVVYINNKPAKLTRIKDYLYYDKSNGIVKVIPQFVETLPNGKKHLIIKENSFGSVSTDEMKEILIPENYYFVVGDNRDNSKDSRCLQEVGIIPYSNLIGKVKILFFSTDARISDFQRWIYGIRFDRFFLKPE